MLSARQRTGLVNRNITKRNIEPIRRNLHFISVAKLLRLSIYSNFNSDIKMFKIDDPSNLGLRGSIVFLYNMNRGFLIQGWVNSVFLSHGSPILLCVFSDAGATSQR